MPPPHFQGRTTRRVLVADDSPAQLQLVACVLESEGYAAVAARDGREAFRILRSDCDFAAAIFGEVMPHLTGPDLAGHMRTERRLMRIPVMIMSSSDKHLPKHNSLASGAAVLLPKPFTSDQLRVMLRMLVGNGRAAPKVSAA